MNNIIGYIISGIIICLLIIISIFNILKKRDISNENKINIGNISLDFMKENFIYMFIMIVLVIFGLCIEIIFIPRKVAQISNKSSNMKPNNMNFFQQILKNNTVPYILLSIIIAWLLITTIQYITEINRTILNSNNNNIDSGQIISRSNRLISNVGQYTKTAKIIAPCIGAIIIFNIYLYYSKFIDGVRFVTYSWFPTSNNVLWRIFNAHYHDWFWYSVEC